MLISSLTLIASCKTTDLLAIEHKVTPVLDTRGATFCEVAEPIYWSKKDTPDSVIQIKKHNMTGEVLKCPLFLVKASPTVP